MTNSPDNDTMQDLARVITSFDAFDTWRRPTHGDPVATVIDRATGDDDMTGELFYRHRTTAAQLHLQFPDRGSPPGLLKAFLDQPFDPCLTCTCATDADTFSARLCRAHRSIAERYGTAYTTVVADPTLILRVHIPYHYRESVIQDTLDAVTRISVAVDELHRQISAPVAEY